MTESLTIRHLGKQPYEDTWQRMQDFTWQRKPDTVDEIWVTEHLPIYTLGLNGKREHVLNAGSIPLLQVDRGGQVTYHGPGQLVVYTLLDLKRLGIGVRGLVTKIEQAVVSTLALYDIRASGRADAPGVYVNGSKIAALGLRIRHGYSYHGLSLNIDMDLSPFQGINPCGYKDMKVCQLADFTDKINFSDISEQLVSQLVNNLASKPDSDTAHTKPA